MRGAVRAAAALRLRCGCRVQLRLRAARSAHWSRARLGAERRELAPRGCCCTFARVRVCMRRGAPHGRGGYRTACAVGSRSLSVLHPGVRWGLTGARG